MVIRAAQFCRPMTPFVVFQIVCITGQVANPVIGTDAFQEADIIGITAPITKFRIMI